MPVNDKQAKAIKQAENPDVRKAVVQSVQEMGDMALKEGYVKPAQNQGNHTPWDTAKEEITEEEITNLIYNVFYPKVKEMHNVQTDLKNIFSDFIKVVKSVGQIIEEYTLADMYPVELNLKDDYSMLFKTNFPRVISRMYSNIIARKVKVTMDVKEVQLRFNNAQSLIMYLESVVLAIYNAVARTEELETSQMFVDYYLNQNLKNFEAATLEELTGAIATAYTSLTVKSTKYNQADDVKKGLRYTTQSTGETLYILTTPVMAAQLLTNVFPYMFDKKGVDFTDRLLLIDEFPPIYTLMKDYTLTAEDEEALVNIDYTMVKGKQIAANTVVPTVWVEAGFGKGLNTKTELVKYEFDNQNFGFIFDGRTLKLFANEGAGFTHPFLIGESLWSHTWYHYSMLKAISPFYNKATFSLKAPPTKPEVPETP